MELLAVMAVLAVLAAVAVFAVGGARERSRDAVCDTERRTLQSAVQSYRGKTGYLPSNEGILVGVFLETQPTGWDYVPPSNLRTGVPGYVAIGDCMP